MKIKGQRTAFECHSGILKKCLILVAGLLQKFILMAAHSHGSSQLLASSMFMPKMSSMSQDHPHVPLLQTVLYHYPFYDCVKRSKVARLTDMMLFQPVCTCC